MYRDAPEHVPEELAQAEGGTEQFLIYLKRRFAHPLRSL
jgi:hypothetical protein